MTEAKRIGKYEIAEKIGVGGFGIVYKAWDPYIRRWVALKVCNAHEKEATARFFREAQLAGALQHPNITLIFDFGVEDDTPYFVQEFLSGNDLDELVESRRPTLPGVLATLIQVCQGLEFAHSRGIVHRDIKPANIRILEDGTVKIMDFGIAKSLQGESQLTQTGVALGTAGYLAPEQLSGQPLSPRTDLFSLGVMGYELITGVRPFAGPNLSNVIYQILNQEPAPIRQRCPKCPERLERAIHRALAKKPENRWAGVREFGDELKEILVGFGAGRGAARAETTTAMVRQEFANLRGPAAERQTAPTELGARPLELLAAATEPVAPTTRRSRWPLLVVLVVAALAAGATALYLGGGAPARTSAVVIPTVPPAPTPTSPPPTPSPTPAPSGVEVELFVDPPSEVAIDGSSLGRVQSLRVSLAPGRHEVLQRIAGYRETTHAIDVNAAGERFNLRLPPFGLLTVMNDMGVPVKGTKVLLDGKDLGGLPTLERKVEAGTHELRITWPDGREWSETVEVNAASRTHRTVRPPT